jgi:nucleotide-binding universal stress UspA family protein
MILGAGRRQRGSSAGKGVPVAAVSTERTSRRLIIVGVADSAESEAAAQWAVREAELRKDDLLLVHAYDVSRR